MPVPFTAARLCGSSSRCARPGWHKRPCNANNPADMKIAAIPSARALPANRPLPGSRWVRRARRLAGAAWLAAAAASAAPLTVQVTGAAGEPLADAAVAVRVAGAAASGTGKQALIAEMAPRGRAFVPPVLVVQAGTAVSFPNHDKVRHHVYSFSPAKAFEIKLYGGEVAPAVVFDKPGTVVLGCNIHDRMVAYVHVVDTPYFARTDAQGSARLDVPAGDHRVQVWHPSLTANQPPREAGVQVPGTGATLAVTLAAEPPAAR
jgi:plastocyanin